MRKFLYHYFLLIVSLTELSCSDSLYEVYYSPIYEIETSLPEAFSITIERGGIRRDGSDDASKSSYERWIRSAFFIRTNGATSLSIPSTKKGQCYIWQYNEKHQVIRGEEELDGTLQLCEDCTFIRFQIRASNTPSLGFVVLYGSDEKPIEEKRVQMHFPQDRLVYDVDGTVYTTALLMLPTNYCVDGESVPLIVWDSGDGSFTNWDGYEGGSYEGRVNGVRYMRDQGFAVLEIYSWGSYYNKKYPGCGSRSAMPIPTHLATHEKGVEYVLSRYNIDADNIFHVSKSGSGKIALFYSMERPSFNLQSIYAFAPVFDDLNYVAWANDGYRRALFEELDLHGTAEEEDFYLNGAPYDYDVAYKAGHNLNISLTSSWQMHKPLGRSFIAKNAEKFKVVSVDWMNVEGLTMEEKMADTHRFSEEFWEGYNRHYNADRNSFYFSWDNRDLPASHSNAYNRYELVRRGSGIPLTVIMSPTDEQTPYWNALEVVKQLQNGGEDARMITIDTGGHMGIDCSTSGANAMKDITTRLGVHYDYVSIGFFLVVEDIYDRFLTFEKSATI